ncbi:hypothetical protein CFAM422_002363 [Trichoderma lentiforme]|uniref:Uncharacterized protein n=1 Tax=Trichoderma lentiforme TaxID=1567552 RepID=A0A9P4XLZ5_9HYPO|nr:hypothetical protein CFAM422_002363 [Trichoderma lentiforme]
MTGVCREQNSRMLQPSDRTRTHNCLHIPHGLAGGLISVATAIARNVLMPLVTAVPKATLSAHVPTGYDAFSTLAPGT